MSFKRFALRAGLVALSLSWALSAPAAQYSLVGGGGQFHIGGGLPLPIQTIMTTGGGAPTYGGTVFPPLLVPAVPGVIINGTTAMGVQQRITVPPNALSKVPAQLTLGQFGQNPTLYAVATNLGYQWPAQGQLGVFSTGARTGAKTTTFVTALGNNIRYSNVLASKFGGPAQFRVFPGPPSGLMPQVPVTIYGIAVAGPGNPPCTHTALTPVPFPGPGNPACVAGLAQAIPTTVPATPLADRGVIGGPVLNSMTTPGGTPAAVLAGGPVPGVGIGKFGANGTVTFFTFTPAMTMAGFTNMATTFGFPWTTGMLTVSAPAAAGAPEIFVLTGMDTRTAGGAGTIQMVAGGAGQRTLSGPNANRGWIRLTLAPVVAAPSMSPAAIAATAGLMLLAVGYAARRRLSG